MVRSKKKTRRGGSWTRECGSALDRRRGAGALLALGVGLGRTGAGAHRLGGAAAGLAAVGVVRAGLGRAIDRGAALVGTRASDAGARGACARAAVARLCARAAVTGWRRL